MRARFFTPVAVAIGAIALLAATAGADSRGPGTTGRLAFAIKDGSGVSNLYSVKPNGDGLVRLTTTAATVRDLCPDYSRDGKLITFCSSRSGSFQIWAMKADGSNVHVVTNGNSFTFPDYSPDASKIVFDGTESASDTNDNIYVINANGTGLVQLTKGAGNNDYPTYSPNGRKIAFISDRTGVEQVWVMNADGSNQTQLSTSGVTEDQVPDWSPDGRKLAFERGDSPNGRIWMMNADGTHAVQLTSGPGDDFATAWSPDGQRIAFDRDFGNGDRSVWAMNANGSDQHRVLPIPLTEYAPTWAQSADNGNG